MVGGMHLAERNNHAARLIIANDHKGAYEELRLGLQEELIRLGSMEETSNEGPSSGTRFVVHALTNIPPYADDLTFPSPLVLSSLTQFENDFVYARYCCATAVFNMGLSCHLFAHENQLSSEQRDHVFRQAQAFYQQGLDISQSLLAPVLHMALLCNLLELSFEQADTDMACMWSTLFSQWMEMVLLDLPGDVWLHFLKVQVYSSCRLGGSYSDSEEAS